MLATDEAPPGGLDAGHNLGQAVPVGPLPDLDLDAPTMTGPRITHHISLLRWPIMQPESPEILAFGRPLSEQERAVEERPMLQRVTVKHTGGQRWCVRAWPSSAHLQQLEGAGCPRAHQLLDLRQGMGVREARSEEEARMTGIPDTGGTTPPCYRGPRTTAIRFARLSKQEATEHAKAGTHSMKRADIGANREHCVRPIAR